MQPSSEEDVSLSDNTKSDFETLDEFIGFKGKALKDLDTAKLELEKRAAQIQLFVLPCLFFYRKAKFGIFRSIS